jgi:hypothetical protein
MSAPAKEPLIALGMVGQRFIHRVEAVGRLKHSPKMKPHLTEHHIPPTRVMLAKDLADPLAADPEFLGHQAV